MNYKFECGCEIPMENGIPKIDFYNLNLDCPKTWEIYQKGQTQSIFQLEKYLGKKYSKELKPSSIIDAANLISIIRPGVLQIKDEESSKNLTQIFCERKNGDWSPSSSIVDIMLKETQGIWVYQEQVMMVSKELAGFDGAQQNRLVKSIGKKDAELLFSLRKEFVDGCLKVNKITKDEANLLFDNIEASARYVFNKCVSPDTLVQTPKGHLKLDDLKIGDFVNSPDGFIEVIDKFECGQKEVVEIELENGKTIICTLDHKFLCGDGKVRELREIISLNLDIKVDDKLLSYKVKNIKNLGVQRTIDITVNSENHIYYGNGIATSNSHAVSYAVTGYWTAWVKAHLPHHYICAWLRNAKNEQKPLEEIRAMISEARRLSIDVMPPSIKNLPTTDFFVKNANVYFGIGSIKGCSPKGMAQIIQKNLDFDSMNYLEFLVNHSGALNKTQMINMIRAGCFDCFGEKRIVCEYFYNIWSALTKTEQAKAIKIYNLKTPLKLEKLLESLRDEVSSARKTRIDALIQSIINPPTKLVDSITNIVDHEKELMGINISCSKIDKLVSLPDSKDNCCDVQSKSKIKNYNFVLIGEISEFREIKIKNGSMVGQLMGSFILTDDTGQCDCVIFPKELDLYQGAIYDGNIIMMSGPASKRGGLIVNKLYEV